MSTQTQVLHFRHDYSWEGVEREAYKDARTAERTWKGIVRQVLVGKQAEEVGFHLRYFEIAPGGYSSLEKHRHTHVVIIARGSGRAVLGATAHDLKPFDTLYIAPWTPHQFLATGSEPFGFFCVVDAERDQPLSVSAQERSNALAAGALDNL